MLKITLVVMFALFLNPFVQAQQVIAQWNFNSALPPDNNLLTGLTTPSMGAGVCHLVGTASPSSTNPFSNGSDNDYFSTSLDNTGWNIRNFPAQGTGNKTAGIFFSCNTTGYQNIIFRFDEKHSSSSPNTTVVQYNLDTTVTSGWIDIQTNKIGSSTFSTTWFTRIIDFSSITAVNNKPKFGVRILAAFDPAAGSNYIATLNQDAASYNNSGGTIRFDMASFTGLPVTTCNLPATQASNPVIISASGTQAQFSFQRGSGDSVLILCREGYAVNAYPKTGSAYVASSVYGSGTQVGTGNYVVYNSNSPNKNTVTVTGLISGRQYYFSIFEYSSQHCYKILPLYFHTTIGGTVFKPGELILVGFDTRVAGISTGNDKYYLTNLVDMAPGTQFCLSSSRYEAGAPANVRTDRWYNSGDYIYKDMDIQEFTWNGTSTIAAGAVIGIEDKMGSENAYDSVTVNGVYQPGFFSDSKKGGLNIGALTTKGEQLYISQGSYYPMGEVYTDRYNLLFGTALFGMTIRTNWVPVSSSPGTAFTGIAYRESRIPPSIECLHIENLTDTVGLGFFNGSHSGNKRVFKTGIGSNSNWKWKVGDTLLNLTQQFTTPYAAEMGKPFTLTASTNTDGTWVGDKSTDWFDCGNWEGLYKPDSTTDAIINAGATFYPIITRNAVCKSIHANPFSSVSLINNAILEIGKLP